MDETPRTRVKSALRMLWLHSKERSAAMKREHYTCQICKKKQSKKKGFEQKVEVHHTYGIGNWNKVIDVIMEEILCDPAKLEVLCPECHAEK